MARERNGPVSFGREFQSFDAVTEKALSHVATCIISEGGGSQNTQSRASKDDPGDQAGL